MNIFRKSCRSCLNTAEGPFWDYKRSNVLAGDMQPQRVGFFEWPSVEAFREIVRDPRVLEIIGIRNDALTYINESNFFTVADNVEITFDSARVYLFMAVWMTPGAENALDEHFQDVGLTDADRGRDGSP